MTEVTVLPRPYQDSKDVIYFENLINELSTIYKTNKRNASDILLSNYRLSRSDPSTNGLLHFYSFTSKLGFTTSEDFEKSCIELLAYIADGYEYEEDPIPGHEGHYNVRKGNNFEYPDDEGIWYGNYKSFVFRRSEVVKYFPDIEINVSDDGMSVATTSISDNWHGKDTAWKMIAGLAIALSKADKHYMRGISPNISKICEQAATLVLEFGEDDAHAMDIENLRKLLSSALKKHTPKLKP